MIAALIFGCAGRIAWTFIASTPGATGEAFNIARAIAEGSGFADAYGAHQGPTAHMLPLSPAIAGATYALFGIRSLASETILAIYSIGLSLGTLLFSYCAAANLDVPKTARRIALYCGLLLPVYIGQEAVDFRIWEGGLTAFLTAAVLYVLTLPRDATNDRLWLIACPIALLSFVNPVFGLAAYISLIGRFIRMDWRSLFRAGVVFALPLAALFGPWVARNATVMGSFIPVRSNAGLELSIGMNPAVLTTADQRQTFLDRLKEVHPAQSPQAFAAMQAAGGEVAYSKLLSAETTTWIKDAPVSAAKIAVLHISEIIAPRGWQFQLGNGQFSTLRAVLASIVGIAGLIGLLTAIMRKRHGWHYPACLVLIPLLALSAFQPIPRYTYLFYPLLLFSAGALAMRQRSRKAPSV